MLMEPNSDAVIRSPEWISNGQGRRKILERREGVYHRKAEEVYGEIIDQSIDGLRFHLARNRNKLAKIVSLRYIAFAHLIRFFDVWTASVCENTSEPRDSVSFWDCVRSGWPSGRYSSAVTHAGGRKSPRSL